MRDRRRAQAAASALVALAFGWLDMAAVTAGEGMAHSPSLP